MQSLQRISAELAELAESLRQLFTAQTKRKARQRYAGSRWLGGFINKIAHVVQPVRRTVIRGLIAWKIEARFWLRSVYWAVHRKCEQARGADNGQSSQDRKSTRL